MKIVRVPGYYINQAGYLMKTIARNSFKGVQALNVQLGHSTWYDEADILTHWKEDKKAHLRNYIDELVTEQTKGFPVDVSRKVGRRTPQRAKKRTKRGNAKRSVL